MTELEITQPTESPEVTETAETVEVAEVVEAADAAEEQALQDATHEPGARVEETQTFEQAEAIETALTEAVENVDASAVGDMPFPLPQSEDESSGAQTPSEGSGSEQVEGLPIPMFNTALEDESAGIEGQGNVAADDDWESPYGNPGESSPPPDIAGGANFAEAPEPGPHPFPQPAETDDPPEPEGPNMDLRLEGNSDQIAQEPDTRPEPSLSPGADGNVAEEPDHGPNPLTHTADNPDPIFNASAESQGSDSVLIPGVDGRVADYDDPGEPPPPDISGREFVSEKPEPGSDPFSLPLEEGMLVTEESQIIGAGAEIGVIVEALDAEPGTEPAEDTGQDMPTEGNEGDEESDDAPDWYLHEDQDGNITVVDENGKPVDSPPNVVYFNGKYYFVYPGDKLPIKEDGTIDDPEKLAEFELTQYKTSTEGMYLHEDGDGNITVVDENGKPVDSPPSVIYHQGKYYVGYPGDDPFNPDGTVKDPSKLVELPNYKTSTEGMYLHEDGDGNMTVVDENGKPVDSPPNVIYHQGKYYAAYPGENPFNPDGTIKDPSKLVELPNYKASTEGIYLHEDKDGNLTVVDENGKPVDSPPGVIFYEGKYYAVQPGENPIGPDGTIKDPSKLVELTNYKTSTEGVYLHEDKDGNLTVVDKNGKPVDSPPGVIFYEGKYYAVNPGDNPIGPDGTIKDPCKLVELSNYKTSTEGMYLHEDGDGNLTVVDENGKPVDSPPNVISYQGKYYAAYPGEDPFNPDGTIKDPSKLVELPNYKPPWWGKKAN